MSTPVVVSRIQNRRGLQSAFDALYDTSNQAGRLRPGELALCHDTNRLFMGTEVSPTNAIGYFEIISGGNPAPLEILLSDNSAFGSWSTITQLTVVSTSFLTIYYSIDNNDNTFSKNGELKITSTSDTATLTDTGVEINPTIFDISFKAELLGDNIVVQYKHNFGTNLMFRTTTLVWSELAG